MTDNVYILCCAGFVFVIFFILIARAYYRIGILEHDIKKTEKRMDDVRNSIELLVTTTNDVVNSMTHKIEVLEKDHDRMFRLFERFTDVLDQLRQGLTIDAEVSNTCTIDYEENTSEDQEKELHYEHSDEIVGYRWIFPDKEESRPVYGQWYNVVGIIKNDTKENNSASIIVTDEAVYNGYSFVTKNDDKFKRVFAYIRMPSSSDVMQQVVDIFLKKE